MPGIIDTQTLHVDDLPGVWAPGNVQFSDDTQNFQIEMQAAANLLLSINIPEAILRLLLNELDVEYSDQPPRGYLPEVQGEWSEDSSAYRFNRQMHLEFIERHEDSLKAVFDFGSLGMWAVKVTQTSFYLEKI